MCVLNRAPKGYLEFKSKLAVFLRMIAWEEESVMFVCMAWEVVFKTLVCYKELLSCSWWDISPYGVAFPSELERDEGDSTLIEVVSIFISGTSILSSGVA